MKEGFRHGQNFCKPRNHLGPWHWLMPSCIRLWRGKWAQRTSWAGGIPLAYWKLACRVVHLQHLWASHRYSPAEVEVALLPHIQFWNTFYLPVHLVLHFYSSVAQIFFINLGLFLYFILVNPKSKSVFGPFGLNIWSNICIWKEEIFDMVLTLKILKLRICILMQRLISTAEIRAVDSYS